MKKAKRFSIYLENQDGSTISKEVIAENFSKALTALTEEEIKQINSVYSSNVDIIL